MRSASWLLLVLTVLWAVDAVLGLGFFWAHDLRHHHLPWRVWAAGEWLDFRIPFWSNDIGCGFPLGAEGQAGVFYLPTMLLFMVFPPEWALNISILLHIWWAGLGTFWLTRSLGVSENAARYAGVAFAFCGFLATHTGYLGMQNAVAWLPWALGFAIQARHTATVLCLLALSAAGHVQVLMMVGPLVVLIAGVQGVRRVRAQAAPHASGLAMVLTLSACSLVVLAPHLQTFALLPQTLRAGGVSAAFANIGSLPVQELLNGVLPHLFGLDRPGDITETYFHRGISYWGSGVNHWETAFYLGFPTVILAALGARKHRLWVALVVASLMLMLGGNTPLWPLLRSLPLMDGFRFPARFSLLLTMGVVVLAAFGFDRLLRREHPRRLALALLVGGGLLWAGMTAAWVGLDITDAPLRDKLTAHFMTRTTALPPPADVDPMLAMVEPPPATLAVDAVPEKVEQVMAELRESTAPLGARVLTPVFVLLLFGALLALRERLGDRRLVWAIIVLVYGDLWLFGAGYNVRSAPDTVRATSPALGLVQATPGLWRTTVVDRRQDPALDTALIQSSMGLVQGTRDVLVPSPLRNVRHEALLALVGLDVGDKGAQKWARLQAYPELVDLLGVRWLLSVHEIDSPAYPKRQSGPVKLYENPDALPNAFLVGCTKLSHDTFGDLPALQPRKYALVERDLGLPQCEDGQAVGTVRVVLKTAERIEIDVEAKTEALLVQTDVFYPDWWPAHLDGESVPVHRVNHSFRGVRVPAGTHRLVFAQPSKSPLYLLLLLPFFGIMLTLERRVFLGREEKQV